MPATKEYAYNKILIDLARKFQQFEARRLRIHLYKQAHLVLSEGPGAQASFVISLKKSGNLLTYAKELYDPSYEIPSSSGEIRNAPSVYTRNFVPTEQFVSFDTPETGDPILSPTPVDEFLLKDGQRVLASICVTK